MRTLLRSVRIWGCLLAGATAAIVGWGLGPAGGLALLVGLGVAGGLVLAEWLRIRQRWLAAEVIQLRGRVATADRLAALADRLSAQLAALERAGRQDHARVGKQLATLEQRIAADRHQDFTQLQALHNLSAMVPFRHRMPPPDRGWAVSPDFLLLAVSLVREHQPATIIELGSGASTVWIAAAIREFEIESRMISIDHDAGYAAATRQALAANGLEKLAEVRHAPLAELELGGESYRWYDRGAFAGVDSWDLLIVDGPPASVQPRSRYPALPVLLDRVGSRARVLLDDHIRADERQIVAEWVEAFPGWTVEEFRFEKGAVLLTRSGRSAPVAAAGSVAARVPEG